MPTSHHVSSIHHDRQFVKWDGCYELKNLHTVSALTGLTLAFIASILSLATRSKCDEQASIG